MVSRGAGGPVELRLAPTGAERRPNPPLATKERRSKECLFSLLKIETSFLLIICLQSKELKHIISIYLRLKNMGMG